MRITSLEDVELAYKVAIADIGIANGELATAEKIGGNECLLLLDVNC